MPGCRPDHAFTLIIEASWATGIRHPKARTAFRRDVLGTDLRGQRVRGVGTDRDKLENGLDLIIARHGKVNSQALGTGRGGWVPEVNGHIGQFTEAPVKGGIEGSLLEAAVEDEIIRALPLRGGDNPETLEVVPHALGLIDPSGVQQPLEIRLNELKREGDASRRNFRPDPIGNGGLPPLAQEVREGELQRWIALRRKDFLQDDFGIAKHARAEAEGGPGIIRTQLEEPAKMGQGLCRPPGPYIMVGGDPFTARRHGTQLEGSVQRLVGTREVSVPIAG